MNLISDYKFFNFNKKIKKELNFNPRFSLIKK